MGLRVVLPLIILLCIGVPRAVAQPFAYGIAGPAGVSGFFRASHSWHAAGGGEFVIPLGVGFGGELGIMQSLGVLSLNASLHFSRSRSMLSPYVTAGYTRMGSGEGSFDAWNAGGGADYWFGARAGLRMEFRDHIRPDARGTVQYWTVRAGIAVR
jgi:hypothetical protein